MENKSTNAQQDLEQILGPEYTKQYKIYSRVNDLIKQNGYKPVRLEKSFGEYYTKQNDAGDNFVFIRSPYIVEERTYHYAFEKVESNKLEEFCKRFDNFYKDKFNKPITVKGFLTGMGTGAGIAMLGKGIYYLIGGAQTASYTPPLEQTMMIGFIGMVTGAFLIGYVYDRLRIKKNKKKMFCDGYSLPEMNDKLALKFAFG